MKRTNGSLITVFVSTLLLVLACVGTVVASGQTWFRFDSTINTVRSVMLITAYSTAIRLLTITTKIALAAALQPAGRWLKLLYVLPIYFLGFTLTGVILALIGIGTVGPFITLWIGVGAFLSFVSAMIALARMELGERIRRTVMVDLSLTGLPSLLIWLSLVASIIIALTITPSAAPAGGPQGVPPNGRSLSTTPLLIGGALMTIFAVIEGASIVRMRRAAREATPTPTVATETVNYRRETEQAIFVSLAITIVGLVLAQLIPVSHTNPSTGAAIQWDSQQTQMLARRACMDCHSNETTWPWYSYVAPGSWLTASHVSEGRNHFNLSTLAQLPADRTQRIGDEVEQQIIGGEMPPRDYIIIHPEARLTGDENWQLIEGLKQTIAQGVGK